MRGFLSPADFAAVLRLFTVLLGLTGTAAIAAETSTKEASSISRTECGGDIERATWALWDETGRASSGQLLTHRLQDQGDSYALYNLEITFHNLLAMAIRCGRGERLQQFAADWGVAYRYLEPIPQLGRNNFLKRDQRDATWPTLSSMENVAGSHGWVCRGGAVCNDRNRLRDTEVMLFSVQGLGLLSHLANALAVASGGAPKSTAFVRETAVVALGHLQRWTTDEQLALWAESARLKAENIADGSSKYFFTDKPLWMIGIYAELAGILQARPDLREMLLSDPDKLTHHRRAIKALLSFFRSRIFLHEVDSVHTSKARAAELDRGYWRLYKDNRYAGYAGKRKPAVCATKDKRSNAALTLADKDVPVVSTLGWDLSHARRLVHVLDALERNRAELQSVFSLDETDLPDPGLPQFFAAQLVAKVWNGDAAQPAFSNYWDGTNGWYRVAYDNGMDRCIEGYPPSGLSDAFPTGGYAVWGQYYPVLTELGLSIYDASVSRASASNAYVREYYGVLTPEAPTSARTVNRMMFWPSLVGVQ